MPETRVRGEAWTPSPGLKKQKAPKGVAFCLEITDSYSIVFDEKLRARYRAAALLAFNACLLFAALNLLAFSYLRLKRLFKGGAQTAPKVVSPRLDPELLEVLGVTLDSLQKAHPGFSEEDLAQLYRETFQPVMYASFTGYRERPRRGRFVNVHPAGFRLGRTPNPWPPVPGDFTIFFFGGSTAFGYGVPDDQTVPSFLQDVLSRRRPGPAVRVYNFGAGGYYSSQERILFEELLAGGFVPGAAVFLDGLNDSEGFSETVFFDRLRAYFEEGLCPPARPPTLAAFARSLPLCEVGLLARNRLFGEPRGAPVPPRLSAQLPGMHGLPPPKVMERYLNNRKTTASAAAAHEVVALFVWQPVPFHACAPSQRISTQPRPGEDLSAEAYRLMQRHLAADGPCEDFLDCAEIQRALPGPLYVDRVHYAPALARRIAECIADRLEGRIPSADPR